MRRILHFILCSALFPGLFTKAQNTGLLYTSPADADDGGFVFPRTYPQTFREGSTINITWATSYESVNLYYYQRGNVANSVQLATNQAISWYQWEVFAEETNLTEPFVFRAVKAQGTEGEVKGGGFWSTSYYVSRVAADGSASQSLSTPTSTVSMPSSSPIPAPTSIPTSTPIASPGPTSSTTLPTPGHMTQISSPLSNSGVNKGSITGLAVGLVLIFLIIVAGLVLIILRRKRNAASRNHVDISEVHASTDSQKLYVARGGSFVDAQHEIYVQPSEMQGLGICYELPASKGSPRIAYGRAEL